MTKADREARLEALRARGEVARQRSVAAKQRIDAKRAELQARRTSPEKRDRGWLLILLVLLLLALLARDCRCTQDPVAEVPPPVEEHTAPAAMAEPVVPEPSRVIERWDRPEFDRGRPREIPWLPAFRMQVAARGPRLAECFEGVREPGSLKWTVLVEPVEGRVSEHDLVPTLQSVEITRQQRSCAVGVLSDPAYTVEGDEPARVSLVIEF